MVPRMIDTVLNAPRVDTSQGLGELGHRPPTETIAELSAFSATRVVFAPKSRRRRATMVNPVGIALTSPTATESELSVG